MYKLYLRDNSFWDGSDWVEVAHRDVGLFYATVYRNTMGLHGVVIGAISQDKRRFELVGDESPMGFVDWFVSKFPASSLSIPHPLVELIDKEVPASVAEDNRKFEADALDVVNYTGADVIFGVTQTAVSIQGDVPDVFWEWGRSGIDTE